MAPNPTTVSGLLRQTVHYHLDNASYENALFFAERFAAQDPKSSEAAYLVATSHIRLRDFRSAYDVSKPAGFRGVHLGCTWVFAQACLALERHKDGISALEKSKALWSQKSCVGRHSPTSRTASPDASALLCLLGKLYRGYDDKKKAIGCFEEALKLNPFMWDAFLILCDMGVTVRVPNIFKLSEQVLQSFDQETAPLSVDPKENSLSGILEVSKKPSTRHAAAEWGPDPFATGASSMDASAQDTDMLAEVASHNDFMSKIQAARLRLANSANTASSMGGSETPTGGVAGETAVSRPSQEPPQAPARKARPAQVIESGLEGPPRMNYRLGARRVRDKEKDDATQAIVDVVYQELDSSGGAAEKQRPTVPTADRKRTVSGYPVSRSTNADDSGTRRSARLNTFKPSSKANAGASSMGAPAGRELKKARPQISRIVRPGSSGSNVGRVVSGNRKPVEGSAVDQGDTSKSRENIHQSAVARTTEPGIIKVEEALRWILDLMKKLGSGYYHLSRFQCDDSLQALSSLPAAHQGTSWVLALMGRAHFEQAAYPEAEKFFRKMRVQAPSRLEDMEVYSTILWHLKRETDLAFLAHELIDTAWLSPQAWCALGNSWSLARDPEQALRCFKRATQLDPKFAYAFTLQGHEHVANEEYDKALTAYRQAIAADRRHYNAYYGIGKVQQRLGVYDKAFAHFQAASTINPNNAVLICCIGKVLEKQKQIVPALQAYTKAAELAPRAAQTRYMKARGLLAVGQTEAAHKELMILKDLAPDEGTVHFLLGTLYRTVNDKQAAVRHYTIALALDPKVSGSAEMVP
jgi:anaphase-promoting complex subunit 3